MSSGACGHIGTHRSRKQSAPKRSCLDSGLTQLNCDVLANKSSAAHRPHSKQPVNTLSEAATPVVASAPLKISAGGLVKMSAAPAPAAPVPAAPAPAAGTAAPHPILKTRRQRIQRPPKAGSCSFCHATSSAMWRNGPEQFPKLCNACGMRYYRCIAKTPPEDPFSAKILAGMARKAARAAAATMGASNGKQTVSGAQQQHSAAFKASRHPKQPSAASAPAATGTPSPQSSVPGQGASGKRVRKATAKALALEEELSQQRRSKRSKAAWQAQQEEEEEEDGAFAEDMTEDDNMSNQGKPFGMGNQQHNMQQPQGAAQTFETSTDWPVMSAQEAAATPTHAPAQALHGMTGPAQTAQHSLQEVVQGSGPEAVSTADGTKLTTPSQENGLVSKAQQHAAGLQATSSLDSAATEDKPQV